VTRWRELPLSWLTAGKLREEGKDRDMTMVSMLTQDRLEVDSTLDERQGAVIQEKRHLAVAARGSGVQG
jgi:hypothetical protein